MKLLFENWRRYLKELQELPLGKYAFPHNVVDADAQRGPLGFVDALKEPDTKLEEYLARILRQHFKDNVPLKKEQAATIAHFIEQNLYPNTFQRYQKGDVYRGMHVPREVAEQLAGPTYKPRQPKQKKELQLSLFPEYERTVASSWSINYETAECFALDAKEGEVSIILIADARNSQNYFIDERPLSIYDFAAHSGAEPRWGPGACSGENQSETIGIGDIKIKDVIWL